MGAKTSTETPSPKRAAVAGTAPPATSPAGGTGPDLDGPAAAVWAALVAGPGSAAATVAEAAGISKSAARKALAALEADGHATRIPGGHESGKRAPDVWQPVMAAATAPIGDIDSASADKANDADMVKQAETASSASATQEASDANAADETPASEPPSSEEAMVEGMDPAAVAEACTALAGIGEAAMSACR